MALDFSPVTWDPLPPSDYADVLIVTIATPVQPGVNAAPSPVFFDVASVTGAAAGMPVDIRAPQFHDLTYEWDFGDPANATPSNAAALNLLTGWKNINKGYGKKVTHVYNDPSPPGGYPVTVTVYERSTLRKGSATIYVSIGDPKVVFPGGQTIIFDPTGVGDPTNYPGATVRTTWANVLVARNANAAQVAQILLAADLTATQMCSSPSWVNIRFGALNPAVMPIISGFVTESANLIRDYNTSKSERVVFGLDFRGDWDSVREQGRLVRPFNNFNITSASYLAMHHRCKFSGFTVVGGVEANVGGMAYNVHSELTVTEWQDYGLHGGTNSQRSETAVIACSVAQNVNARSGGGKDTGFYNNHGCFRSFADLHIYMAVCDFFSRNGWSTGGTDAAGYSVTSDQACIRLNTNGQDGCMGNFDRMVVEGMMWFQEQGNGGVPDKPGNYVFDKFINILGPRTLQEGMKVWHSGYTFRNGQIIILDAPSAQTNSPDKWADLSNEGGDANNNAGVDFHGCTFIDLRREAYASGLTVAMFKNKVATPLANVTAANNIDHQPNRTVPIAANTLDLATDSGIVVKHKGPAYSFRHLQFTLLTAVPNLGDLLIPYSWLRRGIWDLRGTAGKVLDATPAKLCNVTNGSTTVTGTNTGFSDGGNNWTGGVFKGPDDRQYIIASMDSATQLTLAVPYAGATVANSPSYSCTAYNNTAVTDQAYWTTNGQPHVSAKHKITVTSLGVETTLHSIEDDFQVYYEASNVRIRNKGTEWPADALIQIQLDRYPAQQAFDPAYDVTGTVIPLARPISGPAVGGATGASIPVFDMMGTRRPTTNASQGALEPAA